MCASERSRRSSASPSTIAPASEEDPLRLIAEGNAFEDEGRLADAAQSYEAAIRIAPKLARAHINRGNVLLKASETEAALASYATALGCDPSHAGAHYNTGNAYIRLGRLEAAVGSY